MQIKRYFNVLIWGFFSQTHKGINEDRCWGNETGLDEAGVLQECLWGESEAEETSDKTDKDWVIIICSGTRPIMEARAVCL